METVLEVENLYVEYRTEEELVRAVNGISLEVLKGENLGLVGETGAGKTTTALTIMGLLPPEVSVVRQGRVLFKHVDLITQSESYLRSVRGNGIGMVFSDPMTSLNPVLTVGEQIAEVLHLHYQEMSSEDVEDRVNEILSLVGIPPQRKNEYPHQFSGGMRQRVVIAMAIVCNPELLIADEPTTALDVTIQAQILDMIEELRRKMSMSMILISHDLGVIAETCEKVAVMYAGEIVEYGSVEHIYESDVHHPYTSGLFGSIPDITKETRRLNPIAGMMPDPTNLPSGCKFHPRCPECTEICRKVAPETVDIDGHQINCHLFAEV